MALMGDIVWYGVGRDGDNNVVERPSMLVLDNGTNHWGLVVTYDPVGDYQEGYCPVPSATDMYWANVPQTALPLVAEVGKWRVRV